MYLHIRYISTLRTNELKLINAHASDVSGRHVMVCTNWNKSIDFKLQKLNRSLN